MDRSDVFLSYRRANVEFAKQLDQAIKATGREVWVDWEDIPPGIAGFTDEIERGIEGTDAMICVLSPEYMQSEYCLMELRHALALNKRIIPIVYNKFEGDAPQGIGHINWVYFCPHAGQENPFAEAFPKVIAALETDFEYVRQHTRLMLRAKEWDVKKRSQGFLLNEGEVDEAQHWLGKAAALQPAPLPLHLEYIVASHKRQTQEQRRARAQLSVGLGVSLVLLVAAVIMTIFAEQNRKEADQSRQIAEVKEDQAQSLALSANAKNMLNEGDSVLALALARTAAQVEPPSAEVQRTLSTLVYAPGMRYRLNDNEGAVIAVTFHPTQPLFLTADATGHLIVYDRTTGTIVHQFEMGQRITAVSFNPTGDVIAVSLVDNTIQLLDASSGEVQKTLTGHTAPITAITFDSSGEKLASGSEDRGVRLWNIATGEVEREFEHPGVILRVVFSPDGTRLATSTADETIADDAKDAVDRKARLWDVATGEMLVEITPGAGFVRSLDYSPDGRTLALGALDTGTGGTLVFYDVDTGEETRRIFAHLDVVTNLVFSPDGNYVASTSWDGSLLVWDVKRQLLIQQFIGFEDRLLSVDYSPDGEYLVVGTGNAGNNGFVENSVDTSVWLIDLKKRDAVRDLRGHEDWIWAAAISPDGTLAATGSGPWNLDQVSDDNSVRLWNIETGEETLRLTEHTNTVDSVVFHPDGKRLLSGAWDNHIFLWDLETGTTIREYVGHTNMVYELALNKAGTQFVSASADGTARLWDTETGEILRTFSPADGTLSPVSSVAFNSDETQIATGSDDKKIRLWNVATGELLRTITGHTEVINKVIFSPDGKWLASSSDDDTVRLWDAATGKTIRHFIGHSGNTVGLAFNGASTLLLSGSQDRTMRLWDVATGAELHRFTGHTDRLVEVVLSPDERTILSVSQDRTGRLWRLDADIPSLLAFADQNRYERDLTCDERIAYGADACEVEVTTP